MFTVKEFEKKFHNRSVRLQDAKGEYAILVPLVQWDGKLCFLFELRAETLVGHQPGEVCFPGGRLEKGELPVQAALRETWEEIGIPPEAVRVMAPLDVAQDISDRVIYPFLAQVETQAVHNMNVNEDEVQEVFFVPVSFFVEKEPYIYTCPVTSDIGEDFPYEKIGSPEGYAFRSGTMEIPFYHYEGHTIWGMTARTVRWLFHIMQDTEQ